MAQTQIDSLIDYLKSGIGRLEYAVTAANRQIPGFYTAWLGDGLVDEIEDFIEGFERK